MFPFPKSRATATVDRPRREPAAAASNPSRQAPGADWRGRSLRHTRFVDWNLAGADLSGADLTGADLSGANLRGANLTGTCFEGANLKGADLSGAQAERACFVRANLRLTKLEHAQLAEADFTEANLQGASAFKCSASAVTLTRANLHDANFARSEMSAAKLYGAYLDHAVFERTKLCGAHMAGIRGYESAIWKNVDIRDIDASGTYLARRFIDDQNYIHEFRSRGRKHEAIFWLWWLTSDCGRSIGRWALLTLFIVVGFAKAYTQCGINYGAHETWFSPFYYSVVTLTSLGYGDVVPTTPMAQGVAMTEVTLGYVMLGGLMSIFSTKMARRAD